MLAFLVISFSLVHSENSFTSEIKLQPVHKDTPSFKRSKENQDGKEYKIKMVKIRDNQSIKQPPQTEANVMYFTNVKLGIPETEYGVLIDFEGKDKKLWVDSDADGDYAEETSYAIFKSDRYPGINVYYSPTPLTFQVKFNSFDFAGSSYTSPMQFDLPYLVVAQFGFYDLFKLETRTWFTGVFSEGNDEIQLALVDTNDNGIYNDPDDLCFVDQDYDLSFNIKESKTIAKMKSFKTKSKNKYSLDFTTLPEKLLIKGDN